MENKELDFSSEVVEKLLLNRCLTDKKYLGIISNAFDRRWIDNENVAILTDLTIKFFKKYNEIPNSKALPAIISLYCDKHPDADKSKLNNELADVKSLNLGISDATIKNNLQSFIESKAMFWAISDNLKQIERDKNADKCVERFNAIRKMTFEDTDLGMSYFSKEGMERHRNYLLNPEAKLRTLWSGLDAKMSGGLLKDGKELTCFCAQAGLGKSLFLSNLAVNLLRQDLSVVVISLEMSENVYAKRFTAHISGDNINMLNRTYEHSREQIDKFYANHPNANLFIKEYPPHTVRSRDIETYLDNLKENGKKFDAVIIDYLNLVMPNVKSDTMYKDAQVVSEELRALSYKYEVPFVTAVQATTSGMNNENLGMQDVAESRGIVHTLDQLFALFQTDEDREHGEINLRILKNRAGGEVGKVIKFKLNPSSLCVTDTSFVDHPEDDVSETDAIINNISQISSDVASF